MCAGATVARPSRCSAGWGPRLYAEPRRPDDADNPVRVVVDAGMPASIVAAFEQRFGVQIFEWYGAIEGGLAFRPPGVGPVASFGKPVRTWR